MAKSIITITLGGLDGMIDAMKEVESPDFLVIGRLEESLQEVFGVTQSRVHVISGRLKASGRTETDFDGKVWEGEIKYGGSDYTPPGYTTPAYYAIHELNRGGTRADGTPHDWLSGLEKFDEKFEEAIDSHFKILG